MMAADKRRLKQEGRVWLDRDGCPVELVDRQTARIEAARGLSRRAQALLAAAGEWEPHRRWYVLRVITGEENAVDNALAMAGVERWLPLVKLEQKKRKDRNGDVPAPKFKLAWPGYVFVKVANTAYCWAGLAMMDGVISVLGTAEKPAPVRDENVLRYKLFLEQDESAREVLSKALKVGQQVRIEDGPFASFPGLVTELGKGDRVKVETLIFGRVVLVDLDLAQLAKL